MTVAHAKVPDVEVIEILHPVVECGLTLDLQGEQTEPAHCCGALGVEVKAERRKARAVAQHRPHEPYFLLEVEHGLESKHVPVPLTAGANVTDWDPDVVDALEHRCRSIVHPTSLAQGRATIGLTSGTLHTATAVSDDRRRDQSPYA